MTSADLQLTLQGSKEASFPPRSQRLRSVYVSVSIATHLLQVHRITAHPSCEWPPVCEHYRVQSKKQPAEASRLSPRETTMQTRTSACRSLSFQVPRQPPKRR